MLLDCALQAEEQGTRGPLLVSLAPSVTTSPTLFQPHGADFSSQNAPCSYALWAFAHALSLDYPGLTDSYCFISVRL